MPSSETTVAVDVRQIPRIDHAEGMRLADTEYQRVLHTVRSLGPIDDASPRIAQNGPSVTSWST
jgi:hypothetical protein